MMGTGPGWGFHQRSTEELVKSATGLDRQPGGGHGPEPPPRPRRWLGAAGLLGFIAVAMLFVLFLDCAGPGDSADASPAPSESVYSPTGSTDQPPSTVMVWPVTARASGESR